MHARVRDCCWIREAISSLVKSSPEVDTGLDTVFQIRDKSWGMWLRNYGLLDDCDVGIVRSFFFCISLSVLPLVLRREIRYVVTRGANSSPVALTQYTERCPPRYGTGDLFLTPSDQWPLLFCVIYTRRTVCCKRSTATGSATPWLSFRSVRRCHLFTTCLPVATSSRRRQETRSRTRSRARAGNCVFFFHKQTITTPRQRRCASTREYLRNCQSPNITRLYPRLGIERRKKSAKERKRACISKTTTHDGRIWTARRTLPPTPGNQSALFPHAETTNRSLHLLPPLVHSCA